MMAAEHLRWCPVLRRVGVTKGCGHYSLKIILLVPSFPFLSTTPNLHTQSIFR